MSLSKNTYELPPPAGVEGCRLTKIKYKSCYGCEFIAAYLTTLSYYHSGSADVGHSDIVLLFP